MSRLMMSVVLMVTLFGVTGTFVAAQDTPTVYTVTAPQTINARGCPRLSCPVLQTFAPGDQLTVLDLVPGEMVLDSDAWLHMNTDGVDLYVHSSLAAPLETAPEVTEEAPPEASEEAASPATGRDADEDSSFEDSAAGEDASGSTANWVTHSGAGFTLLIPPSWIDLTELLYDEAYLATITEFLGEDSNLAVDALTAMCGEGACDVILVDLRNSIGLFMMHLDMAGMPTSAALWKILMEQQFEQMGAEVIDSAVVELASGDAVRTHLTMALGEAQVEMEYIVYIVLGEDQMYLLMFYVDSCCVEDYSVIVDQVAEGFRIDADATVE